MIKKTNMLEDAFVKECQEDWNPAQYDEAQYNDWSPTRKAVMKAVANEFYKMPLEQYRQVLMNTRGE